MRPHSDKVGMLEAASNEATTVQLPEIALVVKVFPTRVPGHEVPLVEIRAT